jgi:hypothetical protein
MKKKTTSVNIFEVEKLLQNLLKFKNLKNLKNTIKKIGN